MRASLLAVLAGTAIVASATASAADPCVNPSEEMMYACLTRGSSRGLVHTRPPAYTPETQAVIPARATPQASPPAPSPPRQMATAAPTGAPTAPLPAGPAEQAGRIDLQFQFASGSADLTPDIRTVLDKVGRQLSRDDMAGLHFRVEGHTDTTGNRSANQMLSERRAEQVTEYLRQFVAAPDRLEARGLGQDELPVPTAMGVSEPRNRIVRIVALRS